MYQRYFGLNELPFGMTPDTSFVCSLQGHQEALNTLLMAIAGGEGFVKITGEVGTGKTLLCRRLLRMLGLGNGWVTAYFPNPNFGPDTLLRALAEELRIKGTDGLDQYHLMRQINMALLHFARAKKRVLVCIDEAQAMPLETLEALRLLSNLETEKRKLLRIVLFGQPELDEKLSRPEVRQLRQRIAFHHHLSPLSSEEVEHYVMHRLRVAGFRGESLFTDSALRALQRASRGAPRLINVLAHKALLLVFGEGKQTAKIGHVRLAIKDTEGAKRLGWLW